ncbi:MAG: hypothetical protein JWO58_3211 [Chitinophagaceae bacterium]|nr:hypothetical protein [Chitinophagaceae bacterium]
MKKTILTLVALTGLVGLSYGQMDPSGTAFTLIYKNANASENCLSNNAPNNGSIAANGGLFANANATTYQLGTGINLVTLASGGTANPFNMFDFPLTVGTGPSAVCSAYRAETDPGVDFSTQSDAKVRIYLHADQDNTTVRFWLGHSGGSYYPTNSTYNIGTGASFIKDLTIGTATTYVDIDYTGDAGWAAWTDANDIDMWGLTYTGTTGGINVTVEEILFGASIVTGTTSSNVVNDQVVLFPNPAKGSFNLDMTAMANTESASVKIMNANGAVVKTITSNNLVESISTDGMNKGIYMVQVTSGNKIATKKVVVE